MPNEYVFNVEGVFARFRKGRDASLRDHFRATVWRCASTTTRPTVGLPLSPSQLTT